VDAKKDNATMPNDSPANGPPQAPTASRADSADAANAAGVANAAKVADAASADNAADEPKVADAPSAVDPAKATDAASAADAAANVIRAEKLTKVYQMGRNEVRALSGVDLTVRRGEMIAIMGASGSGKSTLMNILGCLDQPTSGEYFLDGVHVNGLGKNALADLRNRKLGFVFQGFNLLSRTSALENVELPLLYDRTGRQLDSRKLAADALARVGLGERLDHHPSELSGGQQQRVAIARALVTQPALLLADEPTGNLDSRTSVEIMALCQDLNAQDITNILVTHEPDIACYAKRIVEVRDGLIRRDEPVKSRRSAAEDLRNLSVASTTVTT
jgi:putative ABC transport system ATP-binding protein